MLQLSGNEALAVDLPVSDPTAGFEEYTQAVVSVVGSLHGEVVLVAQSLAGFIAPLVADRAPVAQIVLVNAMVPRPGESAGAWWENTGQEKARADFYEKTGLDMPAQFDPLEAFHDVPPEVVEEAMRMEPPASRFDTLFKQPWPLKSWPHVPTRFLQGRDDRFFPLDFQRRVVAERLAIPVEVLPGGHLIALSQPNLLAESVNRP